jgi:hypothetical protein
MSIIKWPSSVTFQCQECDHEWDDVPNTIGHAWETCPNCGADDGENCWDCGINVIEEDNGGEMCTTCHRTLCWVCTGGLLRAFSNSHDERCGKTNREL